MAATMPPAIRDETARAAIDRADRTEKVQPLVATIQERCGDKLVEAFVKCVGATFTGR